MVISSLLYSIPLPTPFNRNRCYMKQRPLYILFKESNNNILYYTDFTCKWLFSREKTDAFTFTDLKIATRVKESLEEGVQIQVLTTPKEIQEFGGDIEVIGTDSTS